MQKICKTQFIITFEGGNTILKINETELAHAQQYSSMYNNRRIASAATTLIGLMPFSRAN